jgi:hypothetical protein
MTKPLGLASLLLFTSALVAPSVVRAQAAPATPEPSAPTPAQASAGEAQDPAAVPQDQAATQDEQAPDISIPGGNDDIVVVGRHVNITRDTPQVVSVLSSADIARTGEGDIAGALSRVTGLSVVGNGFVYVRGLGDRYSLALLNGSPLPSPEPLRRVVPLDIFPTNVVASSLVQKSYSVNYPGEFGGGVINLTTNAVPNEASSASAAGSAATRVTTGQLGYVYAGGGHDWTGFDDGTRGRTGTHLLPRQRQPDQRPDGRAASGVPRASWSMRTTALLQSNDKIPLQLVGRTVSGGTIPSISATRGSA